MTHLLLLQLLPQIYLFLWKNCCCVILQIDFVCTSGSLFVNNLAPVDSLYYLTCYITWVKTFWTDSMSSLIATLWDEILVPRYIDFCPTHVCFNRPIINSSWLKPLWQKLKWTKEVTVIFILISFWRMSLIANPRKLF